MSRAARQATGTGAFVTAAGPLRVVRGLVVSGLAVSLGVGGHTLGGGAAPSIGVWLLFAVILGWPCAEMSSREWTIARLAGVFLIAQGILHLWLTASGGHHMSSPPDPRIMASWHVAATVACVMSVRYGERSLYAVGRRLPLRRALRLVEHNLALPDQVAPAATHFLHAAPRPIPLGSAPARGPPSTS